MNECAENALCTTSNRGQSCSCNEGYSGDGKVCKALGSCDACSNHASCEELSDELVKCTCNKGYDGDGVSCTGNMNCDVNNGGCSPNACCIRSPGGRDCMCNSGYSGSGKTCVSVVCLPENNPCDENADCTDGGGRANCTCSTGYAGNGFNCSEYDTVRRSEAVFKFSFSFGQVASRGMKDTFSFAVQRDVAEALDVSLDTVEITEVYAKKVVKKSVPVEGMKAETKAPAVESKTAARVHVHNFDQSKMLDADLKWRSVAQLVGHDFDATVQIVQHGLQVFVPCIKDNGGCAAVEDGGNCTRKNLGEVECECANGYIGDGFNCTEIDPCTVNSG